jgi:ABC-type multidrug transport system permease subunit
MNRWYALEQLFLARLREFYREPEAIFWVYGFPLILALGLGIAFSSRKPEPPDVDVVGTDDTLARQTAERLGQAGIKAEVVSRPDADRRLDTGKTALIVEPAGKDGKPTYTYVYDEARAESVSARYQVDSVLQRAASGSAALPTEDELRSAPGTRYIDFLLPGLIGLNIMGGGLWGVGFVLVDMRVRKLLKRLLATPMRRGDFLVSILGGRMAMLLPEMAVLVLFATLVFSVPLLGSPLTLVVTIVVGATAFAGLGLLIACRTDKTETVSGLMNLVMLPMWLLSGTFFSSRRFPDATQPFIQALPLTQLNNALREVMLEGASLTAIGWRLGILAAWGIVCFALALRWFRWS